MIILSGLITSKELVIPLVAAILGIGFPLLTQSTQRIDEKYSSTRLVKRFYTEKKYITFIWYLIGTIIILFYNLVSPPRIIDFAMLNPIIENSSIILATISTGLLVISLFRIIRLNKEYSDPEKLQENILKSKDESSIRDWTELFIFNLKTDNQPLIRASYSYLYEIVIEFRKDKKGEIIEYANYIYDLIISTNETLCAQEKKMISVNNGNDILNLLYDQYLDTFVSEKTFSTIWICLTHQLHYNRDEWVMEYWINAHQYFGLTLNRNKYDYISGEESLTTKQKNEFHEKNKERFLEFHLALGGLLLYKEKYKLLEDILYHTNQQPSEYYLIPGSLDSIIYIYMDIYSFSSDVFYKFEQRYQFLGVRGINSNEIIKLWITKYLAVLVIRLYTLISYYIFDDPLKVPPLPETIREKKFWMENLPFLKRYIMEYCKDEKILNMLTPHLINERSIVDNLPVLLIENLECKLQIAYDEQKQTQQLSPNKKAEFNDNVKRILNKMLAKHIKVFNNQAHKAHEFELINGNIKNIFPSACFIEHQDVSYFDYDTVVANKSGNKFLHLFSVLLLKLKTNLKTYRVKSEDLFTAIDKLEIVNREYVVLCFGLYMDYYKDVLKIESLNKTGDNDFEYNYKGIIIYSLNSTNTLRDDIIIIKQNDLPHIEFADIDAAVKEKFFLLPIDNIIKLHTSTLRLNDHSVLKEEVAKQGKNEDLSLSTLVCVELNAKVYYNKNVQICRLNLINQFQDYRNDNLTEIAPLV